MAHRANGDKRQGLSDHSSDTSTTKITKKIIRKVYSTHIEEDETLIPEVIYKYLESEKKVQNSRLLLESTPSATSTNLSEEQFYLQQQRSITSAQYDYSNYDYSSGQNNDSEVSSDDVYIAPNFTKSTRLTYGPDPFVTNRLILARNALENLAEEELANRYHYRKRRFLRMAFNLFHIDSMEEFCECAGIRDESRVIRKYEPLLVRIDSGCNKWEKAKHEARLALKEEQRLHWGNSEYEFDSDVSTPRVPYNPESMIEELYSYDVPYAAQAIFFYKNRDKYDSNYGFFLDFQCASI